ncbi:hypothetical protein D3C79_1104550 [compost metagenome]
MSPLMSCMFSTESGTGFVLGIAQIVVKPPFAADAEPVAMVSLCSNPGSRKCV